MAMQDPGLLERLKVAGVKGLSSPGFAVDTVVDYLLPLFGAKRSQNIPRASEEGLTKALGYTPEQVQARSFPESTAQRFLERAPLAGTLGGLSGLGLSAVGSVPGAAGEYATGSKGFGDILQLVSELGLGLAPQAALRKLPGGNAISKTIGAEIPTLNKASKTAQTALEQVQSAPHEAQSISSALKDVSKKLGTEVRTGVRNTVTKALETIGENISKKKISPHDAVELRKNLYKLGRELGPDDAATYINPLTKGIKEFFTSYSAENPAFWKALNTRDRLTELKHMNSKIQDFAGLFSFGNRSAKKIIDAVISPTLGKGERFVRGLINNTEARKLYFDMASSAFKNDPSAFIKAFNLFADEQGVPKKDQLYGGYTLELPQSGQKFGGYTLELPK